MDITQVAAAANNTTTPTTTSAASATALGTSSEGPQGDFETFLKLLTAQLRNQDPLKPLESTDFVAQLATFSSVEQQVQTNQKLDSLANVLGATNTDSLASWINREVRGSFKASFDGTPIDVAINPVGGAEKEFLVVKNEFGNEVSRQEVSGTSGHVTWDGQSSVTNTQAPFGNYAFSLQSYSKDAELIGESAGEVFVGVKEVQLNNGDPILITDGGEQVAPSDITAFR